MKKEVPNNLETVFKEMYSKFGALMSISMIDIADYEYDTEPCLKWECKAICNGFEVSQFGDDLKIVVESVVYELRHWDLGQKSKPEITRMIKEHGLKLSSHESLQAMAILDHDNKLYKSVK